MPRAKPCPEELKEMFPDVHLVGEDAPELITPCDPVEDLDSTVRKYLPKFIKLLIDNDLHGLSLNQVGINKRLFIMDVPGDHIRVFVNPEIKTYGREVISEEGCGTFPGKRVRHIRKRHAVMHAFNLKGEQFYVDTGYKMYSSRVSMLMSAVMQHEMDHLNGVDMREHIIS